MATKNPFVEDLLGSSLRTIAHPKLLKSLPRGANLFQISPFFNSLTIYEIDKSYVSVTYPLVWLAFSPVAIFLALHRALMFVCRNRISRLITQEAYQCGHPGMATTAAKTRTKYWILQVHDLVKTVKFKCIFFFFFFFFKQFYLQDDHLHYLQY